MNNAKNISIIVMPDSFNIYSIQEMEECWEKTLSKNPEVIGVECGNLKSIDSSAIGTIAKFYKTSMEKDIELYFIDLDPKLAIIFDITKINRFISIVSKDDFDRNCSAYL